MKKILPLLVLCSLFLFARSQSIGIGTATPNAKAALDIKATDKGVLLPRLTSAQRNAISNPPDGLMIFNTDEHCLNYFDSVNQFWNCYCFNCETIVINISSNTCKLDFYNNYFKNSPAKKYIINVLAGVTISGCNPGDTALSFSNMVSNTDITINNYGTIEGGGGKGGNGTIEQGCGVPGPAGTGQTGGPAISTKAGVVVKINNYGIIAGGGGGGGGSGGISQTSGYGGGGGGGAGIVAGTGGNGGGVYTLTILGCALIIQGTSGSDGQPTTGGSGGAGASGGFAGGNGGGRGQPGTNGSGHLAANGGAAGKAISGGSGNSITNLSGGQSFGTVD